MVLLGIALLIVGLILGWAFLWVIGIVLLVVGLIGNATGRRVY